MTLTHLLVFQAMLGALASGRLGNEPLLKAVLTLSAGSLSPPAVAMFLDAATVMCGQDAKSVLCIWNTMYEQAGRHMQDLMDQELVHICDGKLIVRDVIRALAWGWASQEDRDKRFWRADQASHWSSQWAAVCCLKSLTYCAALHKYMFRHRAHSPSRLHGIFSLAGQPLLHVRFCTSVIIELLLRCR